MDTKPPTRKRGQRGPDKPTSPRQQLAAALAEKTLKGRALLNEMVEQRLAPMITATLDSACGAHVFLVKDEQNKWVRVTDPALIDTYLAFPEGQYWKVSTQDPDIQAAKYLIDQAIGKAVESHEVTGKGGGPVVVRWKRSDE